MPNWIALWWRRVGGRIDLGSPSARSSLAAGSVLLALMTGHAMRETARDTIFLSHLPASRLPWAYLAIAALALAIATISRRRAMRFPRRSRLVATLVGAACIDVVLYALVARGASATPFAFYVWTGLVSTAVTVQFWLYLADTFDVGAAKRDFPRIAAGGLLGAVLGSAAADWMLPGLPTRSLLLGAAVASLAAGALLLAQPARPTVAQPPAQDAPPAPATQWLGDAYLRRIFTLALLVAGLGIGIDFLFKSTVAEAIPRQELGPFFARFNVGMNGAALLFQLVIASTLLQWLGVVRTVAIFPATLLIGAAAALFGQGLLPVMLLKGADGTLRHSLHRAGSEILYLPVPTPLRSAVKTFVDSVGQRGGQALASLGILLAVSLDATPRTVEVVVVILAALTLGALVGLRGEYVERFRGQLRALSPAARSLPKLELQSLEVLVSSLSSPNDADVLSALELLEAHDKFSLVTPLILHHPSSVVVLRALNVFATSEHPHVTAQIEHLLGHEDPEVRAVALQHYATRAPAASHLMRMCSEDPSLAVRGTALLIWLGQQGDPEGVQRVVDDVVANGNRETRLALARISPRLSSHAPITDSLRALAADSDPAFAAEMAQAAAAQPQPRQISLLIALLARREARTAARAALVALGEPALLALADALQDVATPPAVRRHLPRTVSRFGTRDAAALLARAIDEGDERVRYKALRGLGRMRSNDPLLPILVEPLLRVARRSLERAIMMLYQRVAIGVWLGVDPDAASQRNDLLTPLLAEKERRALERVFRVLHILEPEHEYGMIFDAVSGGGAYRAGSREILEHLVEGPLCDGILAMVDDAGSVERLRRGIAFFEPDGAKRWLDLMPPNGASLRDEHRERLDELAHAALEAAARDHDPILVSVARRQLRIAAQRTPFTGDESGN